MLCIVVDERLPQSSELNRAESAPDCSGLPTKLRKEGPS